MTVWRQPEAPLICIRPIPLSCALSNSACNLQGRVISRQYTHTQYTHSRGKNSSLRRAIGVCVLQLQIWTCRCLHSWTPFCTIAKTQGIVRSLFPDPYGKCSLTFASALNNSFPTAQEKTSAIVMRAISNPQYSGIMSSSLRAVLS